MRKNTFYSKKQNYQIQRSNNLIYKIDEFESGQRLDKWIKRKFQKIPQSFIEKLSRKGKIKLNEKKTKLSYKIREGDVVELPFIEINKKKKKINKKDLKKLKKEIKKKIIHKDKEKIIIDKPPGISVHKGSKVFLSIDDIRSSLRFSLKEDPRIVHRIDKETSGLLMLARTYKSSVFLSEQFKKRKIKKFYIAILNGVPKKKEGSILDDIKDKTKKKSINKIFLNEKNK